MVVTTHFIDNGLKLQNRILSSTVSDWGAVCSLEGTSLVWLKINVDGAVDTVSGAAAVGGVFRSSTGEWYFGFAHSIGFCSSLNVELWAILDGLRHAWRMGLFRIIIEMDCLEAVRCIEKGTAIPICNVLLIVISGMVQRDWGVLFEHVPRRVNEVADGLAR
ncbi:hypothetical protein GQ457_09G022040 [Hibiscus cannabinus]